MQRILQYNHHECSQSSISANVQLQNEFHQNKYSRHFDWTRDVTLNHGKRGWVTTWSCVRPNCSQDALPWCYTQFGVGVAMTYRLYGILFH